MIYLTKFLRRGNWGVTELARVRKELEEKDDLLMRTSKRARGRRDFYARYYGSASGSDSHDYPATPSA